MWSNTLQKCQRIAHSVRLVSCECRWIYRWVDVHYFLQQEKKQKDLVNKSTSTCISTRIWTKKKQKTYLQKGSNCATWVPQHWCQVWHRLTLLAELQQGIFSGLWTGQLIDPLVNLLSVDLCQGRHISHSLQGRSLLNTYSNNNSESPCNSRFVKALTFYQNNAMRVDWLLSPFSCHHLSNT